MSDVRGVICACTPSKTVENLDKQKDAKMLLEKVAEKVIDASDRKKVSEM